MIPQQNKTLVMTTLLSQHLNMKQIYIRLKTPNEKTVIHTNNLHVVSIYAPSQWKHNNEKKKR